MSKGKARLVLFGIGALGYGLIEVLWRGYTHYSMLTAGGICFCFFSHLYEKYKNAKLFLKAIVGSIFITCIELIFGIFFNIVLRKNVWDYSKMPLNVGGQICVIYSFFWVILSIIFIPFAGYVTKKLNIHKNCRHR